MGAEDESGRWKMEREKESKRGREQGRDEQKQSGQEDCRARGL